MSNIWFTSDTHFGHGNIIKFCLRPFLNEEEVLIKNAGLSKEATIDEYNKWKWYKFSPETVRLHDNTLIDNWNSRVNKDDDVYHIGDFAFGRKEDMNNDPRLYVDSILDRLNGKITLIIGNHERLGTRLSHRFADVQHYKELEVADKDAYKGKRLICLLHYAMRVWNCSHHGAWHAWGHSHAGLEDDPKALSADVGVDNVALRLANGGELKREDYRPISYNEFKGWMEEKTFEPIDHHGAVEPTLAIDQKKK